MKTIKIKKTEFPFRGYYAQYVLENGHIPGVLSGSNLQGNARLWGGWYADQRLRVCRWASDYACNYQILSENRRWTRLWSDHDRPVRFILI